MFGSVKFYAFVTFDAFRAFDVLYAFRVLILTDKYTAMRSFFFEAAFAS